MKQYLRLSTALAVGAFVLGGFSSANAITITNVTQDAVTVATTTDGYQAPTSIVGTVDHVVPPPGSSDGLFRSPWEVATTNAHIEPYWSTLDYTSVRAGNANYNISGNKLSLFWGSPDDYNSITFWTGLNETGDSVTLTGTQLLYGTYGSGHDQVSITLSALFNSVVIHSEQPAFEFANLENSCTECAPPPTPLPGALPLLASAMAGMGGLLGWRKRRKAAAKALAA